MLANASACADQRIRMRYITYTVEFLRMQNRPKNRLLELFCTERCKKYTVKFANSKIMRTFAPVFEKCLITSLGWPVRLSVRTQDFHS